MSNSNCFPLGVWLQHPTNAGAYRAAGFNLFVGLWQGPTESQLTTLRRAGLNVVCEQNETGLRWAQDATIVAWMQSDEPDNATARGASLGFGSPTSPAQVLERYRQIKFLDPTRPVLLNLGQGVAWDGWSGRGNRNRHPEDYPEYLAACDIASFDIYPANHESGAVAGNLWFVAEGVRRLTTWTKSAKPVWNLIECTAIKDPKRRPTPQAVRAEAWMSIVHGSSGLIFFCHQFKPRFQEAALLADPEMLAAVTALNQEITELAPVLNATNGLASISVRSANAKVPVAILEKQHGGQTYLFAVGMRDAPTTATFSVPPTLGQADVEVLSEKRTLTITNQAFTDSFAPWGVHLYRLR